MYVCQSCVGLRGSPPVSLHNIQQHSHSLLIIIFQHHLPFSSRYISERIKKNPPKKNPQYLKMDTRMFIAPRLTRGLTGVAVAGMGIGIYMYTRNTIHADSGVPKPTFGTGPAFLSLQLESTEDINHNTRRLRFKLPEPNAVSGLSLTCESGRFTTIGMSLPFVR